jgi:hypothetical protein
MKYTSRFGQISSKFLFLFPRAFYSSKLTSRKGHLQNWLRFLLRIIDNSSNFVSLISDNSIARCAAKFSPNRHVLYQIADKSPKKSCCPRGSESFLPDEDFTCKQFWIFIIVQIQHNNPYFLYNDNLLVLQGLLDKFAFGISRSLILQTIYRVSQNIFCSPLRCAFD